MALTFPLAPVNGATHNAYGITYTYSAANDKWTSTANAPLAAFDYQKGAGSPITLGITTNSNGNALTEGDMFFDTVGNVQWFWDATNGAWVKSGSAISTADLADGAVTSAKIADGTIATVDIADDAITGAKIADNAVILGTHTVGNYMSNVTAGTGIRVTHTAGEGTTATIAIAIAPRATDPTTKDSGAALTQGDFYYNTTANTIKTFNGTTWNTVGDNADQVGSAIAGLDYGAVGTYIYGSLLAKNIANNSTYAGSSIVPAGILTPSGSQLTDASDEAAEMNGGGSALTGTWRAMGRSQRVNTTTRARISLFLRIS